MAGETNAAPAPTPGSDDRGLSGKQPTVAEQISSFRGASFEDGVIKGAQDGVEPIDDPDNEGGEGDALGDLPPRVDGKDPTPKVITPAPVVGKKESAQERINKAVRAQRTAERETATLRAENKTMLARLDAIDARLAGAPATAPLTKPASSATTAVIDAGAPDPTKYQYGDLDPRYLADLARHTAIKVFEDDKTAQAKTRQTAEQQQAAAAFEASKTKLVADALADFPDFQEVVMDSAVSGEWDLTKVVGDLAFESAQGPAIMYHLATNVDESKALAKLTPAKQAVWFGKMEAYFAAKNPPKSSGAANGAGGPLTVLPAARMTSAPPVPERRVRGNGNPNPVSPDTTDFAAFERLAKQATH